MSKKIYISPSNQQGNTYATGNTNERAQCKKIAKACADFLTSQGFTVKCTYHDVMETRVKESNEFGADMHIAIHTNATGKHNVTGGTQVYVYELSGERKKAGQAVFKELSAITPGTSAEKLIAKPDFYEVNSATGMTLYCECEFHDTKEGSDFIIKNTKALGEAIARGVCNYYGVKIKTPGKTDSGKSAAKTVYTVQVGAFTSEKNAEKYLAKLKVAGFEGFIKVKQ